MADIKRELKKLELVDTIGGFEVSYTLTNHGENNHGGHSFGLFIENISWEMFGWYPRRQSLEICTYLGEFELEGEGPYTFDFTQVEEKIFDYARSTMYHFINDIECTIVDAME